MDHAHLGEVTRALNCQDIIGVVHAVSGFLDAHGSNTLASQQFDDSSGEGFSCVSRRVSSKQSLLGT